MEDSSNHIFFISGISRKVNGDVVENYFRDYGDGVHLRLKRDKNGLSLGYGWLTFEQVDMERVLVSKHVLGGSPVILRYQSSKKSTEPSRASAPPPLPSSSATPATEPPKLQEQSNHHKRKKEEPLQISTHIPSRRTQAPKEIIAPMPNTSAEAVAPPVAPQKLETAPVPSHTPVCQAPPSQHNVLPPPGTPAQPVFVCIPLSICPGAFLHDPRVFCCTLDPSHVGKLSILATPTSGTSSSENYCVYPTFAASGIPQQQLSTSPHVQSVYSTAHTLNSMVPSSSGVPPPPGPPPPQSTAPIHGAVPPPPGPPPSQSRAPIHDAVPPPPGPPPPQSTAPIHGAVPPPPGPPPSQSRAPIHGAVPPPPGPPPPQSTAPIHGAVPPPPGPPPVRGGVPVAFLRAPGISGPPPPPGPPPLSYS